MYEKFDDLPPETKKWLGELRAEDLENLKESVSLANSVRAGARVGRWLFLFFISTLVAIAQIADGWSKLAGLFKPATH